MDDRDNQAIADLFEKIAEVERRSGQRDAEADAFIRSNIARQPAAPYYMAQTIVVQEQALAAAEARIQELEQGSAARSEGGFLSTIFGGGRPQAQPRRASPGRAGSYGAAQPWGASRGGGGFLAGAAQTAMGVAGGVLLGNMVADMFSSDTATAADATGGAEELDAGADTGSADVGGGDFGGGDFDLGDF